MEVIHNNEGKKSNKNVDQKQELYEMLKTVPAPPKRFNLSVSQKFWWYWFGYELVKTKSFAQLDQIHLQSAAYWLDAKNMMLKIINRLNRDDKEGKAPGLVQHFKTGSNNITAYVTIIEKAEKHLNNISEHFGLSIKDRQKLISPKEVDPDQISLFEDFMNQKTM